MYRERLVECADCGDRFKIVYDSRKEEQDEYKCKCGKFVCHPDYFGSFSYERDGNYKDVPYAEQENKREYYDEDYIKLTDEEQKLLNEIDEIGKSLDSYTNNTNECYVRLELFGCSKSNEGLTIQFETRLESWAILGVKEK